MARTWVGVGCRSAICAVAAALLVACASTGASTGAVGSSGSGPYTPRREERRIVGNFGDVRAMALSRRYVFAAASSGIAVYDRLFNAWQLPVAQDAGLTDAQITAMVGDPTEDAVWIGVPGAVISYRPQSEQLLRTTVTGVPDVIAFDRQPTGDAFVRASGQWTRVSRSGIATPMIAPPIAAQLVRPGTLGDVYARYPGLRSGSPLLFRNQRADRPLRTYPVTSGAMAVDQPSEVWLGTQGDGLYKLDGVTQQATPIRYGLLDVGVGALALAPDGVWSAGVGLSSIRSGLTFATTDLQRWRWVDGTISVPMIGWRASSMSLRENRAWIGTNRGVVRVQLDASESMTHWGMQHGLPDDRVTAVLARDDGAWVATLRGLVFVNDSAMPRTPNIRADDSRARDSRAGRVMTLPELRALDNVPVYALQRVGDTLWIGSNAGLLALPGHGELSRPLSADPALRRRIVALAHSDTVLLAATDDAVLQLDPRGGREPSRVLALNVSQVGQITRLAMDDRTIVMAGSDGVVVLQRRGGVRVLNLPRDLPGPAMDIALAHDWIWIGTPYGLVRLRRAADGGLP